jgi:hypothetical protein
VDKPKHENHDNWNTMNKRRLLYYGIENTNIAIAADTFNYELIIIFQGKTY